LNPLTPKIFPFTCNRCITKVLGFAHIVLFWWRNFNDVTKDTISGLVEEHRVEASKWQQEDSNL